MKTTKSPRKGKGGARKGTPRPPADGTLPTAEALRQFILDHPESLNKREIARAFGIKGQDRTGLRRLLREMSEQGMIEKTGGKSWQSPDSLQDRALIEILETDGDGELRARPLVWHGKGPEPIIYVTDRKSSAAGLKKGDHVLARLKKTGKHEYEAKILKSADNLDEERVVGVFRSGRGGGHVTPTDKKNRLEYTIPAEHMSGAQDGDLVIAASLPASAKFPRSKNPARISEVLGHKDDPKLISLIAIHSHSIPTVFAKDLLKEADALTEPDLSGGRIDMRDIPLVTIDGADARDFDDAVFAEPDTDPKNAGGWKIIVAIADVSYYVRPFTVLDREAFKRGNSTYFADRVVPMLPERLSNDLCSLRPLVNRACLAAFMTIDKDARLVSYRFARGLMRSAARLTYEQVEEAHLGRPDDLTGPLLDRVIRPLYKAYGVMLRAREKRGALELDLPERKAVINDKGIITAIVPRQRLDSHKLIEEFMILANVAAAEMLEGKNAPCLYRVHEPPSFERIEAARDFLKDMGYSLPKSDNLHPRNINHLLKSSSERGEADLVHTMLLRTQSQAVYSPENNGHFGLALQKYAHFTSPIRRYADLIVHRSLVSACGIGGGGELSAQEKGTLDDIAEHISTTERRSMIAERDVMDRFTAQYLSAHVGEAFQGRVSSVQSFGLFVSLVDSGADGIVPMRQLPRDYYVYDEKNHTLTGKNEGRTYRLADKVVVRLLEADPLRGSTVFEMLDGSEEGGGRKPRGTPHGRRGQHGGKRRDGDSRKHNNGNDRGHRGGKNDHGKKKNKHGKGRG